MPIIMISTNDSSSAFPSFGRQGGRTLIELIIAIAIGLVIVAGVASLYLSSSQVSRVANQVGAVEDGGQLAMFVMGDAIRMAGFGEIVGSSATSRLGQTQFDGPQIRACSNGTFAAPFATPPDVTCVPSAGSDQLFVSYQSNNVKASAQGALGDCLGQVFNGVDVTHATTVDRFGGPGTATVPIATSVFGVNAGGQLECTGKYGVGGPTTAELVAGVTNFKVFFGFDNVRNGAAGAGQVDLVPMARMWLDAAAVNAAGPGGPVMLGTVQASPWDNVVSVFVCVTIVTNQTGLTTAGRHHAGSLPRKRNRGCDRSRGHDRTSAHCSGHRRFHSPYLQPGARGARERRRIRGVQLTMSDRMQATNPRLDKEFAGGLLSPARRFTARRHVGGVVLPVVLVILVILTALVVTQVRRTTVDQRMAANAQESVALEAAAKAVLGWCEVELQRGNRRGTELVAGVPVPVPLPRTMLAPASTAPAPWRAAANWVASSYTPAVGIAMGNVNFAQCLIEDATDELEGGVSNSSNLAPASPDCRFKKYRTTAQVRVPAPDLPANPALGVPAGVRAYFVQGEMRLYSNLACS